MTLTSRIAEVGHPAAQERIEFPDHLREADPSAPASDLPDACLGALLDFRGAAQRAAPEETVAEKLTFLAGSHRALFPVDAQPQDTLQELRHRLQHPLSRCLGLHVDVASSSPGELHPQALTEPDG